jgi:hypothetical protein
LCHALLRPIEEEFVHRLRVDRTRHRPGASTSSSALCVKFDTL